MKKHHSNYIVMSKRNKQPNKGRAIDAMERTKFGMYKGPIEVGQSKFTDLMVVVNLTSTTTTSASGLGIVATELTFNPNTTTEWTSYAARYREYRVLAVEVHFIPSQVVNISGAVCGPCAVATNKGGVLGTPTSIGQVYALANSKPKLMFKPWSYQIRPDDYTDLDVGSTSTPSSEFSMLVYGDGFTNSLLVGRYFIKWVVQFSSRQ